MILYPQLPHPAAELLANERRLLSVEKLVSVYDWDHADMVFTPTGGNRAEAADLQRLRNVIVSTAVAAGYPVGGDDQTNLEFDRAAAAILHDCMQIEPSEASKPGVWEYLTCVLLSDVVRWRFPGNVDGTPLERFFAGRRNALQRLWWRAFALYDPAAGDRHKLLGELGEDEIVQIMERPFLAGSRTLSRTIAGELVAAATRYPDISRRTLIREAQKRLRRFGAFISFEAIADGELTPFVRSIFDQVAAAVK